MSWGYAGLNIYRMIIEMYACDEGEVLFDDGHFLFLDVSATARLEQGFDIGHGGLRSFLLFFLLTSSAPSCQKWQQMIAVARRVKRDVGKSFHLDVGWSLQPSGRTRKASLAL